MNKELIKYFENGITIDKLKNGKFSVFTVATQRFTIDSLEELNPESFEKAMLELKNREEHQKKLLMQFELEIKNTTPQTILRISPKDFTIGYFLSISEMTSKNENDISGPKYHIELNDGTGYDVYVYSVKVVNKKSLDQTEVTFFIEETGKFQVFTINQLKKIVKDFVLIY